LQAPFSDAAVAKSPVMLIFRDCGEWRSPVNIIRKITETIQNAVGQTVPGKTEQQNTEFYPLFSTFSGWFLVGSLSFGLTGTSKLAVSIQKRNI
jgi:hypothetical protein